MIPKRCDAMRHHASAAAFIRFATRRASPACAPVLLGAPGIEGDGRPRLARSETTWTGGRG